MWFKSWQSLLHVLVLGACTYVVIVAFLRITGKRTLSGLSAPDLVITVAMGNILAMVMLDPGVTFVDAAVAMATVSVLGALLDTVGIRGRVGEEIAKAAPSAMFWDGRYVDDELRRQRVTRDEVRAAARGEGHVSMDDVFAVILEGSGRLTTIPRQQAANRSALEGVKTPEGSSEI